MPEEKSEFKIIAAAAHDLKTPLTYIRGAAASLQQGIIPDHDQAQHLLRIEQSAQRMMHLIDGVIGSAKANQSQLDLEPLNANDVLYEAVGDITPYAAQLGRQIDIRHSQRLPLVIGHRLALRRVLFNLLDNAIRYSEQNRPIILSARRDGKSVRLSVRDFGIGLRKSDLERIFKLFGQVANPAQAAAGGSGLGLYIAAELSDHMNSELNVRSLSQGSSFFIRLPIAHQLSLV